MKPTFLFTFFLVLSFASVFSQTYQNPYVESVGDRLCFITKVEYTKQHTIVSFEHLNNNNGWIRLAQNIHIKTPEGKRYNYIKSEGISIAPAMDHFTEGENKRAFTVYFEPLPKKVKVFDILEVVPGSRYDFNFYGVNIEKKRTSDEQTAHFSEDKQHSTEVTLTPPSPHDFMNGMGDMYKNILKSSIEASLNYFKQPGVLKELAKLNKTYYDALIAEGFTREQALQILISTSFIPKAPVGN